MVRVGPSKQPDPLLKKWGGNIAQTRKLRRPSGEIRRNGQDEMSQADLGAMLDPPVSQATVSRWEGGWMEPRREYKAQLAYVLGVDGGQLFPLPEAVA